MQPEQIAPVRSCVICATQRSGSTLLGRGLGLTGLVGEPEEYLNPVLRPQLTEQWGCASDLDSYIAAVHAHTTTPDGLFAVKVHWSTLVGLRTEAGAGTDDPFRYETASAFVEQLFPRPTFIRIIRLDLDAQAVSLLRAVDSGVWELRTDSPPPEDLRPKYNYARLDHYRRQMELGELCWERLIRSRGVDPLVVTYEELLSDYAGTIAALARQIVPGAEVVVQQPYNVQQRDEWSLEFVERFRREREDRQQAHARARLRKRRLRLRRKPRSLGPWAN